MVNFNNKNERYQLVINYLKKYNTLYSGIAKRFSNDNYKIEDVWQDIYEAALIAIDKFNPNRSNFWKSYVRRTVENILARKSFNNKGTIYVPQYIYSKRRQLSNGVANEKISPIVQDFKDPNKSLLYIDNNERLDFIPDRRGSTNIESNINEILGKELIRRYLIRLLHVDPREYRAVYFNYGLGGNKLTLEQIGNMEGVSKERIRQFRERGLRRLTSWLRHENPDLGIGDFINE